MNKYKNLLKLQELTKDIEDVSIPSFVLLDYSYFDLYLSSKKEFKQKIKDFFNTHIVINKDYILRSSALLSEDNESIMWAGLYESKMLDKNTLDEFINSIEYVYQNFFSERALEERKRNNIEDDKMEIIVQEHIFTNISSWNYAPTKGFVNSTLKNNKDVIHIDINNHPVLVKKDIPEFTSSGELFGRMSNTKKYRNCFLYPYDVYQVGDIPFIYFSHIIKKIRKRYWREYQLEFIYSNNTFHLVQIRPLPNSYLEEKNIIFPKQKEYISIPFPFKKEKTKLYPSYHEYKYPNRFYFTDSSHQASLLSNYYIEKFVNNLPEVICFELESLIDHWHLQSLALQKNKLVLEWDNYEKELAKIKEYQNFYIIADGKEMRIYEGEKEEVDEERIKAFLLSFFKDSLDEYELNLSYIQDLFDKEFWKFETKELNLYLWDLQTDESIDYLIDYRFERFFYRSKL